MEEKTQKKKKKKMKGKGNLLRPAGMAKTSTVGTAEADAEGTTGMGTMGMAGAGIPMPATTSSPLKVFASREIGIQIKRKKERKKRVNLIETKRRHIPIKSGSGGALSSKSEILFFRIGTSSGSSRMSSDPSEDKSVSGPRVAELGMEKGVTTREALSFAAWERAAKGSLVEIISGRTGEVVLD